MFTHLTHETIDVVCDSVPTPWSIDPFSGEQARRNVAAGIRRQLMSYTGVFRQTTDDVSELVDFLTEQENASQVQDGDRYGLSSSEALTVGPGAALQKLFSSVEQKRGGGIADMVTQLDTLMRTTANRPDQVISLHLDGDYAEEGNFNLIDFTAACARFISSTVNDLLAKSSDNNGKGYIIGILADSKLITVPSDVQAQRERIIREEMIEKRISVEPWDIIGFMTDGKKYVSESLQMLRIFLDAELMYARKISMQDVVNLIMKPAQNNMYAVASSIDKGIVDIFAGKVQRERLPQYRAERMLLGTAIPADFELQKVSGLDGVRAVNVIRVELQKLISFYPARRYDIVNIGVTRLSDEINASVPLTWRYIRKNAIIIPAAEVILPTLTEVGDIIVGEIDAGIVDDPSTKMLCVIPAGPYLAPLPTDEQLEDMLILRAVGEDGIDNLWSGALDHVKIFTGSVDSRLIYHMLGYCGLQIVAAARHETLYDNTGDLIIDRVYVRSQVDPAKVIKQHMSIDSYQDISQLSSAAEDRVASKASVNKVTPQQITDNADLLDLDRIFNYYRAELKCKKKPSSKADTIALHVTSHPYFEVLNFPFVDKNKTVSNDPHTMTAMCGTNIGRVNYLTELTYLYSTQTLDRRHYLFASDYVFTITAPAGIGFHGSKKQGSGSISLMVIEQPETQLLTIFDKPPEPASNLAPSLILGLPPTGVSVGGKSSKERIVAMFKDRKKEFAFRVSKRYRDVVPTTRAPESQAGNEDHMNYLIQSRLVELDPYQSIPTFKLENAVRPTISTSISIPTDPVKRSNAQMLAKINIGLERTMVELSRMVPLRTQKIEVILSGDFLDINSLYDYIGTIPSMLVYLGAF